MKLLLVFVVCASAVFAYDQAQHCLSSDCQLKDDCVCSSTNSPLALSETPQVTHLKEFNIPNFHFDSGLRNANRSGTKTFLLVMLFCSSL